ncbi:MAG: LysR family transcriptional regulator [Eubacteriales bacterium]|nr:LysR family transcriptional regulator [Eubacteriales bacterium]
MELRELTTFITIAQTQSFSKAAALLNYSQAAVTIQIRQLEKELGVQLFDRLGKQITLTNRGRIFYDYALQILSLVSEASNTIAEEKSSGSLHIGTIDSLCDSIFPSLLKKYHRLHPSVTLNIVTETPAVLMEMLARNELDFVYLLDEQIFDDHLVKVIERRDRVVFAACASHPLAGRSDLTLDELLSYPFILTEKDASYRRLLEQRLLRLHKTIEPYLQARRTDLIMHMLCEDMAVSFLPKFLIDDKLKAGVLTELNIDDFQFHIWHQVIHHKNKWITREMKFFFELLRESLSFKEDSDTHPSY